jgi:CheY-like chemotaxis protein
VPLKILLADDSMTAQKMGKEILTSAGYEVIAVSNGAAAAKKLVEKPDICVLDIIMPGYTGIEVCEKIRASIETAKMPVLLTVGKMEHYDQKDVQRVAADGVIVKPFEATDLLATIQKFVDKLNAPKAAAAAASSRDKTIAFTPPNVEEFKDDSYNQWKTEAEVHDDGSTGEMPAAKKAAAMEVSAEAAAAPAFMDFGGADATPSAPEFTSTSRDKTVLITPPSFAAMAAAPEPAPVEEAVFTPPPVPVEEAPTAPPAFDLGFSSGFTPAAAEPAASPSTNDHALEFTAHAPVEVNPPMIGGFEATAHAPVEVRAAQDPSLATGTEGFDSFKTKIGSDDAPTAEFKAVVSDAPVAEDDDFEKRVAAAMSQLEEPAAEVQHEVVAEAAPVEIEHQIEPQIENAPSYEHTQKMAIPDFAREPEPESSAPSAYSSHVGDTEIMTSVEAAPTHMGDTAVMQTPIEIEHGTHVGDTAVMETSPAAEADVEPATHIGDTAVMQAVPEGMVDAALVEQMQAAVANLPVETAPADDTQELPAVVEAVPAPVPVVDAPRQDLELAKALAAAVGAEAPVATASAASDHPEEVHQIAHTVTQVFERMLPNIMEEVKRELAKRQKK